jgi:hypothetical protein
MQLVTHTKANRLGSSALRLVASLLSVLVLGVAAIAQSGPVLTLNSPVSIFDFLRQNINTTSVGKVVTISNGGSSSLTISTVTVTGVNPTNFLLSGNTCNGATLAPNATCVVTVAFRPTVAGSTSARLTVTNTAAGSQHLVPLVGVGINPAVPNRDIGPIDARVGFPLWLQDDKGVRLALCLDANGLCLATLPNVSQPASVNDRLINFPGEAFWWSGAADMNLPNGGRARLTLSKEAAFTTDTATIGNQISFDRVRVRIDGLTPNVTYTVTHPFGVLTLVADADGSINTTEDIGCGSSPCDFRVALNGTLGVFLKWDPAIAPVAPIGYVGDPNVPHAVTGSPLNTNFFRVAGPNVGGTNVNTIQTTLFTVSGKLFQ